MVSSLLLLALRSCLTEWSVPSSFDAKYQRWTGFLRWLLGRLRGQIGRTVQDPNQMAYPCMLHKPIKYVSSSALS